MSANLVFHVNTPLPVAKLLLARGLERGNRGDLAAFATWKPPRGPPGRPEPPNIDGDRRGMVELRKSDAGKALSNKRSLAEYLESHDLCCWSPATVLDIAVLQLANAKQDEQGALWFLKHASMDRNEGVTVHLGSDACCSAWQGLPREEQCRYVAQREVPNLLLDNEGRKFTLRIYVLVVADVEDIDSVQTVHTIAAVRREYICRSHPERYEAGVPDASKHIHSTLGKFEGVSGSLGSNWGSLDEAWPAIKVMLTECIGPFLPNYAKEAAQESDTRTLAGTRRVEIFGVDALLDQDMRPWLIEINQSPQLLPVRNNETATAARSAVIDDILRVTLDPFLLTKKRSSDLDAHPTSPPPLFETFAASDGPWEELARDTMSWSANARMSGVEPASETRGADCKH